MATITLEFIGLHLFHNDRTKPAKQVAVINAARPGVVFRGVPLDVHKAYIEVEIDGDPRDWPLELTGSITFKLDSERPELDDSDWTPPKLDSGCGDFGLDALYFTGYGGKRHAIIHLDMGCLTVCKLPGGAIITRVKIPYEGTFSMCRDDERHIVLTGKDATIRFINTEVGESQNDLDWLWYYEATGNSCMHSPVEPLNVPVCEQRSRIVTLTLGCSNSNWP